MRKFLLIGVMLAIVIAAALCQRTYSARASEPAVTLRYDEDQARQIKELREFVELLDDYLTIIPPGHERYDEEIADKLHAQCREFLAMEQNRAVKALLDAQIVSVGKDKSPSTGPSGSFEPSGREITDEWSLSPEVRCLLDVLLPKWAAKPRVFHEYGFILLANRVPYRITAGDYLLLSVMFSYTSADDKTIDLVRDRLGAIGNMPKNGWQATLMKNMVILRKFRENDIESFQKLCRGYQSGFSEEVRSDRVLQAFWKIYFRLDWSKESVQNLAIASMFYYKKQKTKALEFLNQVNINELTEELKKEAEKLQKKLRDDGD